MDTMEFKLERQTFCAGETVLDTSVEQSVEKDFVLPDYCADIFRILKCVVDTRVLSQTINGGKLTFELGVSARVLYCSEGDSKVNCIVQKMNYTKSLDLADNCQSPSVFITSRCDYVNCRVISPRRLDIRGAVTSHIKVVCEKTQSIVTDASGGSIQLKKQLLTYPAKRLTADKRVTVIEELELAGDKPPVTQVIRTDCFIQPAEQKIIAGKLVTKGDANLTMLYTCVDSSGEDTISSMRFTVPFSQIIDVDGIDESFDARVRITPSSCEIMPAADSQTSLECELVMLVSCEAVKYETADVVTDAYSTRFECELKTSGGSLESVPESVEQTKVVTASVKCPDENILCVYDSWASVDNTGVRTNEDDSSFVISGNVRFSMLAKTESGTPVFLETQEPFEHTIALPEQLEDISACKCEPDVCVKGCEYRISQPDRADITAELAVRADVSSSAAKQLISDITLKTDSPKKRDDGCAVKLCYCGEQDDIWDIAKRYSTSVTAIMEENELDAGSTAHSGMLLIPLMN
ncbi:MAG: DUF3794 domain-containing protein [Ruminococcus sp.]|nr:DUF3794 domain-containing protein [Ruminococcus sp.]